jgi:hypothetical protein
MNGPDWLTADVASMGQAQGMAVLFARELVALYDRWADTGHPFDEIRAEEQAIAAAFPLIHDELWAAAWPSSPDASAFYPFAGADGVWVVECEWTYHDRDTLALSIAAEREHAIAYLTSECRDHLGESQLVRLSRDDLVDYLSSDIVYVPPPSASSD